VSIRPPQEPERSARERAVAALATAAAFLTVLPTWPSARGTSEEDVKASRFAFPVVGLALGLGAAALSLLLDRTAVPPSLAAFLLVATLAAVTGGLHLDGLADSADGLFLWGDSARRLAAMRDPHVGSYGVSALVLLLLGKYAAIAAMSGRLRATALFAALTVGRSIIVVSAGRARYARPDGTGRLLVEATSPQESLAAAALALLLSTLTLHVAGLVAACVVLAVTLFMTRLAERRLGGITGDTLGALVELGETGFLVCLGCLS
jgi:adenosylcobinamide-GDP ribazoletransferase